MLKPSITYGLGHLQSPALCCVFPPEGPPRPRGPPRPPNPPPPRLIGPAMEATGTGHVSQQGNGKIPTSLYN